MTRQRPQFPFAAQFPLEGDGWIPLFCATQWIVARGDPQRDPPANDRSRWFQPIREIIKAAQVGHLRVIGESKIVGRSASEPVTIDPVDFMGCSIAYPFEDPPEGLFTGEVTYLRLVDYDPDEEHPDEDDGRDPTFTLDWLADMNDALWRDGTILYSHLLVEKSQVRTLWPKSAWASDFDPKEIVVAEMERRLHAGIGCSQLRAESREVAAWYRQTYFPDKKPLSSETVRGHIRAKFWELRPDGAKKAIRTSR